MAHGRWGLRDRDHGGDGSVVDLEGDSVIVQIARTPPDNSEDDVNEAGIELSPRSAAPRSTSADARAVIESPPAAPARVSTIAQELAGSLILAIGAEVRALAASGKPICNLTVGDFSPAEFSIPRSLLDGITTALQAGHTNYPPSDGVEPLRRAISDFYKRRLAITYPFTSVLVTSGARPAIYGAYRVLVDPGDRVVFPVPSWNNNYYSQLIGAEQVTVRCGADTNFLPTAAMLSRVVRDARMLVLNSPLNPTGTLFDAETLTEICDLVLTENARRERTGDRPLYLLYDQVYWMLTFGDAGHVNPIGLRPAMLPYTILIDAISKSFAATGLRVGWAVGPADVIKRMSDVLGHVGAWAPRAEQIATAQLLNDDAGMDSFHAKMRPEVQKRLDVLATVLRT
ncbi:MAG TPA: aminotransferase class I/II-fold pyridoxal phosphate-dependent enzyme, partial [Gemmatimonadaceae bacterium]|nr:aminotransferase class I/II-fold pyridoxal phosphate-dependent enzyme [Gemmatimonadaceae bacterium]